jgi:hypothetical protein
MTLLEGAVLGFLLAGTAFPQEVGVVDLTEPEAASAPAQTNSDPLAPGCTNETVGIMGDGVIVPDDSQPRRISLEIVNLSSNALEVSGEARAEVRLRNSGETPIQIPWSKDSGVFRKAPDPDHLEWEQGNLSVVLKDRQNHTITLKSTGQRWLFGSRFVPGSQMTVKPGEWITAFLSFKVEDMYHIGTSTDLPIGGVKLFVRWEQAMREWSRENCAWNRMWFRYEGYYQQERPTRGVQIKRSSLGDRMKTD